MIAVHHIVSDPQAMTVTVGPRVYGRPRLVRIPERWTQIKEEICGPADTPEATLKEIYHRYAFLLGPKFNRRFQAANYWLWVGHRMSAKTGNMLRREGKHWKAYHDDLVWRANRALHYVNEAERDGLFHLIPAIVAFGASPQEIRRRVGQGAWRQVANNSVSRNCRIMHAVERIRTSDNPVSDDVFVRLLEFPSGVMRAVHGALDDEVIAARITPYKRPIEFTQTVHIVRDTRRMTAPAFNSNWSLKRMVEEHNEAMREHARRRYSDKRFASDWSFERGGFTATMLTSRLDIATEGATQHHCVASYAGQAANGEYAVFRIEGKERATAGVHLSRRVGSVDQVYGAYNKQASDDCLAFVRAMAAEYDASVSERKDRAA